MFSQFFGQYLLDNQKITAEQFSSCMKYIKDNRVKLGLIAENEGLLTRNQANELNYLQMQTDKRFGDLAVEKGYLTEADVNYLLGRQGNPYLIFIQGLEENGIMSRDEIETALDAFQKENGFSDEILKAIQDGNIEGMIPAFVDAKDSRYQSLIGLYRFQLSERAVLGAGYEQCGSGHREGTVCHLSQCKVYCLPAYNR